MGGARKHAKAEVLAIGELGHGRSLEGLNVRQHLGGARKTHAVVRFHDINKFHHCLRCHFVHEQLESRTCHSCGIYLDFISFRRSMLRARSLQDDALLHEVYHRWRRASKTTASSIIQNDLVAIC